MAEDVRGEPAGQKRPILRVIRNRRFMTVMATWGLVMIGIWMQRLTVSWLTWQLTQSSTWLGIVTLCHFLPTAAFGPYAGYLVDRFPVIWMLRIGMIVATAQALLFAGLAYFDAITLPLIIALVVMLNAAVTINLPAIRTLVAKLVAREEIPAGVSVLTIVINIMRVIGPALAGFLLAIDGPLVDGVFSVFAVNALGYGGFLFFVWFVMAPDKARITAETDPTFQGSVWQRMGLSYTLSNGGIRQALILYGGMAFLTRPLLEMAPAFAAALENDNAKTVSIITAAAAAGAMSGGLWSAWTARQDNLDTVAKLANVTLGVSLLLMAGSLVLGGDGVIAAVALFAFIGASQIVNTVSTQSTVQIHTLESMAGRTMAVYILTFRVGTGLGGLALGALADTIGLMLTVGLSGGGILLLTLWVALADPDRGHRRRPHSERDPPMPS